MGFLRTLFWMVITVIVVVFSVRNWVPVTVSLFGDIQADVKLPILLLLAFLLGFVPLFGWHRLTIWRHARRLAAIERITPPPVVVPSPYVTPTQTPPPITSPDPFQAD